MASGPAPAAEASIPADAGKPARGATATAAGANRDHAGEGEPCDKLLGIGAAAAQAGVTERALRYYQELGLLDPWHTPGGMRRYSDVDMRRVARIRELQTVLGLNLDEIASVLRNEDRAAEIRAAYFDDRTDRVERLKLLEESLGLANELRRLVEDKRSAIDAFVADLDARIARIRSAMSAAG